MNKQLEVILRTIAEAQQQVADAKKLRSPDEPDGVLAEAEHELNVLKKKLENLRSKKDADPN